MPAVIIRMLLKTQRLLSSIKFPRFQRNKTKNVTVSQRVDSESGESRVKQEGNGDETRGSLFFVTIVHIMVDSGVYVQ